MGQMLFLLRRLGELGETIPAAFGLYNLNICLAHLFVKAQIWVNDRFILSLRWILELDKSDLDAPKCSQTE